MICPFCFRDVGTSSKCPACGTSMPVVSAEAKRSGYDRERPRFADPTVPQKNLLPDMRNVPREYNEELEGAMARVLHDLEGPWPDHPPGKPDDDRPLREPITDIEQLPPPIQQAIRRQLAQGGKL